MTTDRESIRRHFDIAFDDLPMVTPAIAPPTDAQLAAQIKGAVLAARRGGMTDGTMTVALRSIFRDYARQEPHVGRQALEQSTARFDRAVKLAIADASH